MPKSVLIIDDDPNVIELIVSIVKMFGVDARVSPNGKDALDAIHATPPDALILDLMMPVMDGFTMLTQLRNDDKYHAMPVIVLSALADQKGMVERLPGIVGSITKGKFSLTELRDLLIKAGVLEASVGTGPLGAHAGKPAAAVAAPASEPKPEAPPTPAPQSQPQASAPVFAAQSPPSTQEAKPAPVPAGAPVPPVPSGAPAPDGKPAEPAAPTPASEAPSDEAAPTVPSIKRSEVQAALDASQEKTDIGPSSKPPSEASTAA